MLKTNKLVPFFVLLTMCMSTGCEFIPYSPSTGSNVSNTQDTVASNADSSTSNVSDTTSENTKKPETITVFSINDLHGSLKKNDSEYELGIARLDYAIKHDVDYDPNTSIIISCGDSWQGSYIAHEDKSLTDDLLSMVGVEAMTLGNHEFDWGIDTIKTLKEKASFPFLACNIKTPNGRLTNELSDSSTVLEKSGVKVGVVGAIGAGQESSIASDKLANYSFSENMDLIKTEIDDLKLQGCDIVILALHDSGSSYVSSIGNTFTASDIQGIFGGHTHQFENTTVGKDIPFLQGGCNSKGYSKMTFSVSTGKVLDKSCESVYSQYRTVNDSELNQDILSRINEVDSVAKGDKKICEFNGSFRRYYELNKFVPETMINAAKYYGFTSDNEMIAIHNLSGIRANIDSGDVTREKIFKVEPFENKVYYIEDVPGSKLSSLMGDVKGTYSTNYYAYMRETGKSFDSTKTYDVITIDYVSNGTYWKRSIGSNYKKAEISDKDSFYICDILCEYLSSLNGKVFNSTDYN